MRFAYIPDSGEGYESPKSTEVRDAEKALLILGTFSNFSIVYSDYRAETLDREAVKRFFENDFSRRDSNGLFSFPLVGDSGRGFSFTIRPETRSIELRTIY